MAMTFRRATTYNTFDTNVTLTADRTIVSNGIKRRCEIAFRQTLTYEDGIDAETLTEELNKKYKCAYRVSDIQYVLNRLHKDAGVLRINRKGLYEGVPEAKEIWKRLDKKVR